MKEKEMQKSKINRRDFVKSAGAGAAVVSLEGLFGLANAKQAAISNRPLAQKKPNVIIIFCDQLRSFTVGCYGNQFVKTPNIDRLAKNGFRFEQGITNSPVSVSARSNLLSGQYSRTSAGSRANEMSKETGGSLFGSSDRNMPILDVPAKTSSDFTLRELTALYYGSVTWVDDAVGEILKSLKSSGPEEVTRE